MQQRQLRLGDVLDDYCPRERRVTNHAIVAMVGQDVKQTRCTTCDAEHEYKQAKVPRQRKKSGTPAALYAQVLATGPKRVAHTQSPESEPSDVETAEEEPSQDAPVSEPAIEPAPMAAASDTTEEARGDDSEDVEEGPVHRPLIRATLPRQEGAPPPQRPIPEFTIRQPGGRNRFRHRSGRGPQQFQGNRSNGNGNNPNFGGPHRGGMHGRPPQGGGVRMSRRDRGGRKRSK
jgi:hypothetical protein